MQAACASHNSYSNRSYLKRAEKILYWFFHASSFRLLKYHEQYIGGVYLMMDSIFISVEV